MNPTVTVINWKHLNTSLSFYAYARAYAIPFVYTRQTVNIYSSSTQARQYSYLADSNLMLFSVLILFSYSSADSNLLCHHYHAWKEREYLFSMVLNSEKKMMTL